MSMSLALKLTAEDFESASYKTPEYLKWHRIFKREFKHELESRGCTAVEVSSPNHFDMSGFFTYKGSIAYFHIEDLRWSKDYMLLRSAKSYKDYTGGMNQFISLANEDAFGEGLCRFLELLP